MIGSEQHFRETLGRERALVLSECVKKGTSRARNLTTTQGFIESRTEPTVAFDFVTSALDGYFDAQPGVRKAQSDGQILWVVDEIYAIRNKKLKGGYRTSNHSSGQQDTINAQSSLEGFPPLIYVTFGAHYSARTGLVDEYVVVKHVMLKKRRVVEWTVDLEELAAGGMTPAIPALLVDAAGPIAPPATIRSKRDPAAAKVTEGGR